MHRPSQRLVAEIESAFEESDPYAVISEVFDNQALVEMLQNQADVWRVLCGGEVHVADPYLPQTIVDLWPKTVLVPDNTVKDVTEPRRPLTADDFIPAYALNIIGGLEIATSGEYMLALEIEEPVSGIAIRLKSAADPDDSRYELTDLEGHLLNRLDQTEVLVILASLAGIKPAAFSEVNPLAQCAVMLSVIGHKYGVSSEEFHTAASMIPDQTEQMATVSGAVIYAHRHIFKHSAVTTIVERLVKYTELDTDVLYRMQATNSVQSTGEEGAQRPTFMKTLASPASYDVKNIDVTEPALKGTSYWLAPDLNVLDAFTDTVQQVVASVVDKTIPKRL